jgi:hypothetical protein
MKEKRSSAAFPIQGIPFFIMSTCNMSAPATGAAVRSFSSNHPANFESERAIAVLADDLNML